jgi:hypothetical protein
MSQGEGLLVALVLVPIPAMGSHPAVARFLCVPPNSRMVLAVVVVLAIGAAATSITGLIAPHLVILFTAPLYQACLLRLLYRRFLRTHGREPVDAAFNFDSGLFHDRVFAFSNFFGGLFPPAALLGWAVWGSGIPPAV